MSERKPELDSITHEILTSYATYDATQRIGEQFLPSWQRIVDVLQEIRHLLFPGFFGQKELSQENIKFHVGNLLARIDQELGDQIHHCLCYAEHDDIGPCRRRAGEMARQFLMEIPRLRELLELDAQAAYDGDPAARSVDEIVYAYPGYYAVTVYRIAHELHRLGVPLMPRIMSEHAHSLAGADIHPAATIGQRFFIDHATGVVIGETSSIGDNVKIYQGVTLGAKSFPKDASGRVMKGHKRHPTIGNGVTIYANAMILGGKTVVEDGAVIGGNATVFGDDIVIGQGARIGSNAFVSESVPAGATVVANATTLPGQ
jgi:serine O-acetyltransferase